MATLKVPAATPATSALCLNPRIQRAKRASWRVVPASFLEANKLGADKRAAAGFAGSAFAAGARVTAATKKAKMTRKNIL